MKEAIIGLIGGSGLGESLGEHIKDSRLEEVETPFGSPSGAVMTGRLGANRIAFINRHGDGHQISPSMVPYAANIFALKKLGVTAVIASGAVGSLGEKIRPKDLVIIDQAIDKTFRREGSFFSGVAAVHCEMAQPFCNRLRKAILLAAEGMDLKVHEKGTYVCMEGPQFSTRAESLMHRTWGGDVIGMTAMPEAKLAREAQMCYAVVALASDYDCWRPQEEFKDKQTLLAEIIGNLKSATDNAIRLIKKVLESDGNLCDDECPCRKSLELAVWTNPAKISKEERERLGVLFV